LRLLLPGIEVVAIVVKVVVFYLGSAFVATAAAVAASASSSAARHREARQLVLPEVEFHGRGDSSSGREREN
jgi:hypothetical protein